MRCVPEVSGITPARFYDEILSAGQPAVFRGLVKEWPVVRAGRESPEALFAYLKQFDRGYAVPTMLGPASIKGRLFYNDDLSGFNFQNGSVKFGAALDFLASNAEAEAPSWFAVQSVTARQHLPGFQEDNPMALLDPGIEARVWLGNACIVAAHHDPSENIACVTAGRRTFTLFPPEEVKHLYLGPFELTPAGTMISMVDFDNPDLDRFPDFAKAMDTALTADLEPGDALYLPYLWWHHVRSRDPINMLVNYWWAAPTMGRGTPREAFLHAMLAIRSMPKAQRDAWRFMFDHYVFETNGPAADHLPPGRRGILGTLDARQAKEWRAALAKILARPS